MQRKTLECIRNTPPQCLLAHVNESNTHAMECINDQIIGFHALNITLQCDDWDPAES